MCAGGKERERKLIKIEKTKSVLCLLSLLTNTRQGVTAKRITVNVDAILVSKHKIHRLHPSLGEVGCGQTSLSANQANTAQIAATTLSGWARHVSKQLRVSNWADIPQHKLNIARLDSAHAQMMYGSQDRCEDRSGSPSGREETRGATERGLA